MKDVHYVVFDFDGTFADTLDLAFTMYNRIAPEYNYRQVGKEELDTLRTRKPQEIFKAFGISRVRFLTLLLRIRKELSLHITEAGLIKGMENALRSMSLAGFRLGILTSNSRVNVRNFIDHHSLSDIIGFIYSGNSLFGKDKVIGRMLEREGISRERVVYVGDETRDIEACQKAGIPVIAVSWGLNRRELLASLHPDWLADDPEDLLRCVQQVFSGKPR